MALNNDIYKILLGEDADVTIPASRKNDPDDDGDDDTTKEKDTDKDMDDMDESKSRKRKIKEEDDKDADKDGDDDKDASKDTDKDEDELKEARKRKIKEDDNEDSMSDDDKEELKALRAEARARKLKEDDDTDADADKSKDDDKDEDELDEARKRKVKEDDDKEGDDDIDWDIDIDDNGKDDVKEAMELMPTAGDDTAADNEKIKKNYKGNERSDAEIKAFMNKGDPTGSSDPGANAENDKIKGNYRDNQRSGNTKMALPEIEVREHIETLFDGETLSEEFKEKVAAIFEAAITEQRRVIFDKMHKAFAAKYTQKLKEERVIVAENIDTYLSYAAKSWVKENEIALESGIRLSLMENFVTGMKTLFEAHYIELPEEKFDVVKDMNNKLQVARNRLNEEMEKNAKLSRKMRSQEKAAIISEELADLSMIERDRVQKLVEDVSYSGDVAEFKRKVGFIKENYIATKKRSKSTFDTPSSSTSKDSDSLSEVDRLAQQITKLL